MIAFEIKVNGDKVALAGVGDKGVLSSIVTWVAERDACREKTNLDVGGLVSPSTHVSWLERELQVGDCVEIRILESSEVDDPQTRKETSHPKRFEGRNFKLIE